MMRIAHRFNGPTESAIQLALETIQAFAASCQPLPAGLRCTHRLL